MIQAYRRGLLKPTLPHGRKSKLRETILLESIAMDVKAQSCDVSLVLKASMIGGASMEGKQRYKMLTDLLRDLRVNDYVRLQDEDGAEHYRFHNSTLASEAVYDVISQAGWVTGGGEPTPDP